MDSTPHLRQPKVTQGSKKSSSRIRSRLQPLPISISYITATSSAIMGNPTCRLTNGSAPVTMGLQRRTRRREKKGSRTRSLTQSLLTTKGHYITSGAFMMPPHPLEKDRILCFQEDIEFGERADEIEVYGRSSTILCSNTRICHKFVDHSRVCMRSWETDDDL